MSHHHRSLEQMYRSAPFNATFDPTIEVGHERATVTIPVTGSMFHAAGAIHGSLYFKVLDDAAFFAVNSVVEDVFVLTTSFTTYLTRPVSSGVLRSEGRLLNRNRSQFIAEAVAYDDQDREVGRGTGMFVRSKVALSPEIGYRLPAS